MNKFSIEINEPKAKPHMEIKDAYGMLIKDAGTNEPMGKVYDHTVGNGTITFFIETGIDDVRQFKDNELTGDYELVA